MKEAQQRSRSGLWELLVFLAACFLGALTLLHHEPWRDEAFNWLLLRGPGNLNQVLADLASTGYPPAYYVLNYGLARLFPSFDVLRAANLVLALAATGLVLRFAPLTTFQRCLYPFGIFPLYQYGVIARSYALVLLLLVAYCCARGAWPHRRMSRLLILSLLAQIQAYATIAAVALLCFESFEWWTEGGFRWDWPMLSGGGVLAGSIVAAVVEARPSGDRPWGLPHGGSISEVLFRVADGFCPSFDGFPGFWTVIIVGILLWAGAWLVLWPSWRALLLYAGLCVPLMITGIVLYTGQRWHHGFYFVFFIAALWLRAEVGQGRLQRLALGTILTVQAGLGFFAIARDVTAPYSSGSRVAAYIKARGLDRLPVVGFSTTWLAPGRCGYRSEIDIIQPVLAALDGKAIFNAKTSSFEPYWRHYNDPTAYVSFAPGEVPSLLTRESEKLGKEALVIVGRWRLRDFPCDEPPLEKLEEFPDRLDYGESYSLYRYRAGASR